MARVFIPDYDQRSIDVTIVDLEKGRFELLNKFERHKILNNGRNLVEGTDDDIWFVGMLAWDKFLERKVLIKKFNMEEVNQTHLLWVLSREIRFFNETERKFLDFFLPLTDILIPTPCFDSTIEIWNTIYIVYDYSFSLSLRGFISWAKIGMTGSDLRKYIESSFDQETYLEIFKGLQAMRSELSKKMTSKRQRIVLLTDDTIVRDILLTQVLLILYYLKFRKLVILNLNPDHLSITINGDKDNFRFDLQMFHLESSFHVKSEYIKTRSRKRRAMGEDNNNLEEEIDKIVIEKYTDETRYKAPEAIMGTMDFNYPTDMWSVGCIFAELLGCNHVLFNGDSSNGNINKEQLNMITLLIGDPSVEDINQGIMDRDGIDGSVFEWFRKSVERRLDEGCKREPVPLSVVLPNASLLALDLLEKMLEFNPSNRITVENALIHPYIKEILDTDSTLRRKYEGITAKLVRNEEGEGEEEEEVGKDEIHNAELARRIFLREKFKFYNPKGILKGGLKGGFGGLKGLIP